MLISAREQNWNTDLESLQLRETTYSSLNTHHASQQHKVTH